MIRRYKSPEVTCTYKEFIKAVSKRAGYLEYEVRDVVDKMILILREKMEEGEVVKLDTLAKMYIREMPPRIVKAGVFKLDMVTKPKRRVKFEVSRFYENRLNNKTEK